MDIKKIEKQLEQINGQLIHISEGNEHQVIMIRKATKAIRAELPVPPKECVPINWSAVMGE